MIKNLKKKRAFFLQFQRAFSAVSTSIYFTGCVRVCAGVDAECKFARDIAVGKSFNPTVVWVFFLSVFAGDIMVWKIFYIVQLFFCTNVFVMSSKQYIFSKMIHRILKLKIRNNIFFCKSEIPHIQGFCKHLSKALWEILLLILVL